MAPGSTRHCAPELNAAASTVGIYAVGPNSTQEYLDSSTLTVSKFQVSALDQTSAQLQLHATLKVHKWVKQVRCTCKPLNPMLNLKLLMFLQHPGLLPQRLEVGLLHGLLLVAQERLS